MAGPCTRRNAGKAPTIDSGTPVPTSAVFCAPTSAPAPASVLGLPGRYMDKNL